MKKVFGYEVEMKIDLVKLFIIVLCVILIIMMWLNYKELMQDPYKVCKDYVRQVCPCCAEPDYDMFLNMTNQSSSMISRKSS